jgi:hypothetical protein
MFELKPLSAGAIPAALARAERYRLLNEASEAESICLDVLAVDPGNQDALVMLLLALTDQFQSSASADLVSRARDLLPSLRDEYHQAYYAGIICERHAKAVLAHVSPQSGATAYEWFRQAMTWYDKAEAVRPAGNDEALLRWNTCARILDRHRDIRPREDTYEPQFLE